MKDLKIHLKFRMIRRSGVLSSRIQVFFVGCEAWIFCSRVTARKQIFCFLLVDNSWFFLLLCKGSNFQLHFVAKKHEQKTDAAIEKKISRPFLKIMMCFWVATKSVERQQPDILFWINPRPRIPVTTRDSYIFGMVWGSGPQLQSFILHEKCHEPYR